MKPVQLSPAVPTLTYYPLGRLQIIQGKIRAVAAAINHEAPRQSENYDTTEISFGKYLAMTACSNCHGKQLKWNAAGTIPSLVIASAYSGDKFMHLLKTGEGGLNKKSWV